MHNPHEKSEYLPIYWHKTQFNGRRHSVEDSKAYDTMSPLSSTKPHCSLAAVQLSVAQVQCGDGDVVSIQCVPLAIVYRVCIAAAAGTLTAAAPAPVVPPAPACAAQLLPDFSGMPLKFIFRDLRL